MDVELDHLSIWGPVQCSPQTSRPTRLSSPRGSCHGTSIPLDVPLTLSSLLISPLLLLLVLLLPVCAVPVTLSAASHPQSPPLPLPSLNCRARRSPHPPFSPQSSPEKTLHPQCPPVHAVSTAQMPLSVSRADPNHNPRSRSSPCATTL